MCVVTDDNDDDDAELVRCSRVLSDDRVKARKRRRGPAGGSDGTRAHRLALFKDGLPGSGPRGKRCQGIQAIEWNDDSGTMIMQCSSWLGCGDVQEPETWPRARVEFIQMTKRLLLLATLLLLLGTLWPLTRLMVFDEHTGLVSPYR